MSRLLIGVGLFLFGQILIWYQTNGQFKWEWCAKNPFAMALIFSIPISFAFIVATKYVVGYFDGQLWPGRFIGFATGITSFAILTSFYMNEGINAKTMISLVLATALVAIQILWK
jgi:Kef-type K+ transport system membrane component KefB